MKFAIGDELEGVTVSNSIKPWRTWITIADIAVWTLSATGIGIAVALLIRNRKLKGEDAKA